MDATVFAVPKYIMNESERLFLLSCTRLAQGPGRHAPAVIPGGPAMCLHSLSVHRHDKAGFPYR